MTDPTARGHGLVWSHPDVVVRLHDAGHPVQDVLLCVQSLLRDTDAGVWLADGAATRSTPLAGDPRVHVGEPPAPVLRRCRTQVEVRQPVVLRETLLRGLCERAPVDVDDLLLVRGSRDLARGRADRPEQVTGVATALHDVDVERFWGHLAKHPGRTDSAAAAAARRNCDNPRPATAHPRAGAG
ncbi:hypothetical protein GCM10025868_31730 [Angustibacter aerolatus]|uniref:AbiEi antitoxin C-terminal domain-containing protein n=1 Tax=Angustibacter aerolatus TaxID=1162965 RepID=A0ABQ6JI70_9ACTN|nr:hypothetical protein GCM10025868_31730 [Angustibacter aerolatus]